MQTGSGKLAAFGDESGNRCLRGENECGFHICLERIIDLLSDLLFVSSLKNCTWRILELHLCFNLTKTFHCYGLSQTNMLHNTRWKVLDASFRHLHEPFLNDSNAPLEEKNMVAREMLHFQIHQNKAKIKSQDKGRCRIMLYFMSTIPSLNS